MNTPIRRAPSLRVPKPFADLVDDPATLTRVVVGFERIIKQSFQPNRNPVRGAPTAAHVQDRSNILVKWFRELRKGKQWGVNRILDSLPQALHAELNGNDWVPSDRACWIPGDGK